MDPQHRGAPSPQCAVAGMNPRNEHTIQYCTPRWLDQTSIALCVHTIGTPIQSHRATEPPNTANLANQTTHETTPRKRNDSTMDCHHVHRATRSRTLSLFLSRTLSFTAVPSHEHTTLSLQTLRPGQDQASSHTMHTHYIRSSALELTVAPTTAPTVEPTTDLTAESTLDCCGSGPR